MIPSKHRFSLKNRKTEFDQSTKVVSSPFFQIVILPRENPRLDSRFCLLVSKRVSPLAPKRHYFKRLVATAIRNLLPRTLPGYDFLIILRSAINSQDLKSIEKRLKIVLS